MDTNVFRYVYTVAQRKSISAAAKELFISQPALTKQISRLEAKLGTKLFERSRTSFSLTPEGEIFVEYAAKYIDFEHELYERLDIEKGKQQSSIKVVTTNRGGSYVADYAIPFMTHYPAINVEYTDVSADTCEAMLEQEAADLAIYTDPVKSSALEYMPLEEDPMILVIARDCPVLKGKDLTDNSPEHPYAFEAQDFKDPNLLFVLSTPEHGMYQMEQKFFERYSITPHRSFAVDYIDTRLMTAMQSGGIVLLPLITATHRMDLQKIAVYGKIGSDDFYRYVIIAKKKGRKLSQGADVFWRFMVEQRLNKHTTME